MIAQTVVHTTGVNWSAVLANVASITVILGAFGAILLRSFRRNIQEAIERIIHDEVTPKLDEISTTLRDHDTRIARLEGVEEGKKQAIAQAGITTT